MSHVFNLTFCENWHADPECNVIDLLFLQARSHGTTVTVAASSFLDASNEFYGNKCVCCVSDFYCGTDLNDKVIFDAVTDAPCE